MTQADANFTPSSFGGGWIEPLTPRGEDWFTDYLVDEASELPAIEGYGWIVEPADTADLAQAAIAAGIVVQS